MYLFFGMLIGSVITSIAIFFLAEKTNKPTFITILPGQRWNVQNLGKVTVTNITWVGTTPSLVEYRMDSGKTAKCPAAVFLNIASPIRLKSQPAVTIISESNSTTQNVHVHKAEKTSKTYNVRGEIINNSCYDLSRYAG
tara:strand:+ start:109 stop:525 length:417 start_codon:yes stop_codon:yes gene_type:complete